MFDVALTAAPAEHFLRRDEQNDASTEAAGGGSDAFSEDDEAADASLSLTPLHKAEVVL